MSRLALHELNMRPSDLPGYTIGEEIYAGRRHVIYKATNTTTSESVILKTTRSAPSQRTIEILEHEYETLIKLRGCGHIVQAVEFLASNNLCAIVLEDIHALSLHTFLQARPPPIIQPISPSSRMQYSPIALEPFLNIAIQLCEGLDCMHKRFIIHCNVNPTNIIYNPDTKAVKFIDFEISKKKARIHPSVKDIMQGGVSTISPPSTPPISDFGNHQTYTEGSITSLMYISPEQTGRTNTPVSPRSDLYSLGVTLYHMLAGVLPFTSKVEDPMHIIHCHIAKTPVPLVELNPRLPGILSQIVQRLLLKNPDNRYQTALGLKADLTKCKDALASTPPGAPLPEFELAVHDYAAIKLGPSSGVLYNRDKEIRVLEKAVDRIANQGAVTELIIIHGPSGAGKTSLIHSMKARVARLSAPHPTQDNTQPLPSQASTTSSSSVEHGKVPSGDKPTLGDEEPKAAPDKAPSSSSSLSSTAAAPAAAAAAGESSNLAVKAPVPCYFLMSKFEQYASPTPYSAILTCLRSLFTQAMLQNAAFRASLRKSLLDGLGSQSWVLVACVPEAAMLLGGHKIKEAQDDGAAAEARQRFFQVILVVIQTFAARVSLVLAIEDVHWCDAATFDILTAMAQTVRERLLIVLTYRDTDLPLDSPLHNKVLPTLQGGSRAVPVTSVPVGSLPMDHVCRMISDALRGCSPEEVLPLAEVIFARTEGNPMFGMQFLRSLMHDDLVTFDWDQFVWTWDIPTIQSLAHAEDMASLIVASLARLPQDARNVLAVAAVVGTTVHVNLLRAVMHERNKSGPALDPLFVIDSLDAALSISQQEGMVQSTGPDVYRFSHDRVQQAAYSLTTEESKKRVHLSIGRAFLNGGLALDATPTHPGQGDDTPRDEILSVSSRSSSSGYESDGVYPNLFLFHMVDHLNAGADLITDTAERTALVRLNLRACQAARFAAAFDIAMRYAHGGRLLWENTCPDPWERDYDLTMTMYLNSIECKAMCGWFEQALPVYEIAMVRARTHDQVLLLKLRMRLLIAESAYDAAVDHMYKISHLLSMTVPRPIGQKDYEPLLEMVRTHLARPDGLFDVMSIPEMEEGVMMDFVDVLHLGSIPALMTDVALFRFVVCLIVLRTFEHGRSPASVVGFAFLPSVLLEVYNDAPSAYMCGRLAVNLADHYRQSWLQLQAYLCYGSGVHMLRHSITEDMEYIDAAYRYALRSGDLLWTAFAMTHRVVHRMFTGDHLADIVKEYLRAREYLTTKYKNPGVLELIKPAAHFSVRLMGASAALDKEGTMYGPLITSSSSSSGSSGNHSVGLESAGIHSGFPKPPESPREVSPSLLGGHITLGGGPPRAFLTLEECAPSPDPPPGWFSFSARYMMLMECFHLDEHEQVDAHASVIYEGQHQYPESSLYESNAYLLHTLSLGILLGSMQQGGAREKALVRARANRKGLERFAARGSSYFQHMLLLCDAELARMSILIKGDGAASLGVTLPLYERAILAAKNSKVIQHEALAHEAAGRVCLQMGMTSLTKSFLETAILLYSQWGADHRVELITQRYGPNVLNNMDAAVLFLTSEYQKDDDLTTSTPTMDGLEVISNASYTTEVLDATDINKIDVATVTKASQTLSQEIHFDRLLQKFMHLMMENAGADNGALLIVNKDSGLLQLKAQWAVSEIDVSLFEIPLDLERCHEYFSVHIVEHVARTKASLVLHEPAHTDFASTPYILSHRVASILCAPVLHNSTLMGVVYLEHSRIRGLFTESRVELLDLLCAQLGISIENSRLYESVLQARIDAEEANIQKGHLLTMEQDARMTAQASETRFRMVVETIPQAVWSAKFLEGPMEPFNNKWEQYTGAKGGLEGDQVHPEDRAGLHAAMVQAQQAHDLFSYQFRVRSRNGTYRWFLSQASPFIDPDTQAVEGWFGICSDINDQKIAEEEAIQRGEILASERKYRLLAEAIPQMVFTCDPDGQVQYVNEQWVQFTGLQLETVATTAHGWMLPVHPEERDKCMAEWLHSIGTTRLPFEYKCRLRQHDGEYRWNLVRATHVVEQVGDGQIVKWFGTCTDIDEQVRAEEGLVEARLAAERSAQHKSLFLANMSHEIRTPMNGMMGMIDLLLDTPLDQEQTDYVETMHRSGQNLLCVVNDILDFSRIEAGQVLKFSSVPISPEQVLAEVVDDLITLAFKKGVELNFLVHPDVPPILIGDPARLRQVLINLIGNSIKFTDEGEIVISCTVVVAPQDGEVTLLFEVRDTGCGIPENQLNQLFKPFFQVDGTASRRHGGSGLGLAISKKWVEIFGGTFTVRSTLGEGSTFAFTARFKLPLPAQASPTKDSATSSPTSTPTLTIDLNEKPDPVHVLCCFDPARKTSRSAAEMYLTSLGCTLHPMQSLAEALKVLDAVGDDESSVYDLCLMELADDEQLEHAINHLATKKSPRVLKTFIVTSAQRAALNTKDMGNDCSVLVKPITRSKIYSCVRQTHSYQGPIPRRTRSIGAVNSHMVAGRGRLAQLAASQAIEGLHVLVAEDNSVNQKVIARQLQKMSITCDIAADGAQAVDMFSHHPPGHYALILMDLAMPDKDGFEAVHDIRVLEQVRKQARIPVIALTANVMQEVRQKCEDAGFDGYVSKPIDYNQLVKALRTAINDTQAHELNPKRDDLLG